MNDAMCFARYLSMWLCPRDSNTRFAFCLSFLPDFHHFLRIFFVTWCEANMYVPVGRLRRSALKTGTHILPSSAKNGTTFGSYFCTAFVMIGIDFYVR